jgi:hypothetical protein
VIEMKWIRAAALHAAGIAFVVLPTLANEGIAGMRAAMPGLAPGLAPDLVSGVEPSTGWIVDRSDNICGLDDPKMLSKPRRSTTTRSSGRRRR